MLEHFNLPLEVKFAGPETVPGTFSGYGSIFGNTDLGGDVVEKGAFKDTLKDANKSGIKISMLLQHGGFYGTTEDELPIGTWTNIEEDDKGLKVEGRLFALDTQKGKYIYEGMQSGDLNGLSIGFRAKSVVMGTKPGEPRRILKKVDLDEVSIVRRAMNQAATVTAVKSAGDLTIRNVEAILRDAGGLSHSQAKARASEWFKSNSGLRDEDEAEAVAALTERFRRLRA